MISRRECSSDSVNTWWEISISAFFLSSRCGIASAVVFRLERPLTSVASFTHSSVYPLPLKRILSCAAMVSLISACISASKSLAPSRRSANCFSTSATAEFSIMLQQAILLEDPRERNSNLLPVNANGDVRLRSVVSLEKFGRVCTPSFITSRSFPTYGASFLIASSTALSSSPRKIEMIAGGASFAPRR